VPAKRKQPAAKQAAEKKLSVSDWTYLAGVFESNVGGIKSVTTLGAAGISKTEEWPKHMAETYGGEAREFITNGGKKYWGWFLDLERKRELIDGLETSKAAKATDPYEFDRLRGSLDKARGKTEVI
jgi:hypothetical protein